MSEQKNLRVFISSPNDVRPERLIAKRVIDRLAREFVYHFDIEPVLWEREPLIATEHFQTMITPPSESDIAVVILWSRLGTPLPGETFKGAITGGSVTGTEWEFEDAVAAYKQGGRPDLLLYRKHAPVLASLDDDTELELQREQKRRVERFFQRWFVDEASESFKAASHQFATPDQFEDLLETHLRGLLLRRLDLPEGERVESGIRWHQGSPYRGLETFEIEHAPLFFGRTRARNELRQALVSQAARGCAFVLVFGASGSGKSSLVKAGLLPDITLPGMVGNVGLCRYAVFRPGDGEADPTRALADALFQVTALPELGELEYKPAQIADHLRVAPEHVPVRQGLVLAHKTAELTDRAEARLCIVVDQLEELFTRDDITDEARRTFVNAITELARSGHVWVVATMRSDFFDRLDMVPGLAELSKGEGRYLLAPPNAAEIGQVIRQPAREAGLRFEIDTDVGFSLDEVIRQAATRDPAALPLLEFTLDQLWRQRTERGELTFAAYNGLGGLEGALGLRAEEAFADLPEDQRRAFPAVLRSLVTVSQGEQAKATSRRVPIDTFATGTPQRAFVETFLDPSVRLLVADGDGNGATVRVAHEALLTHWPRAADRIAEDRHDIQARARLEQTESRWHAAAENDKQSLLLNPGLPLSEASDLVERRGDELTSDLCRFVEASRQAAEAAERRRLRRTQAVAAVLGLLAVAAAGFGWYGLDRRDAAEMQRQTAINERANAEHNLEFALGAVDRLALEIVHELESNFDVPTRDKLYFAERVDENLRQLTSQIEGSVDLRFRYADALASIAFTLYESGRFAESRDSALRAYGLVSTDAVEGRDDAASAVTRARAGIVLARNRIQQMDFSEAENLLNKARDLLERASADGHHSLEGQHRLAEARLTNARVDLLISRLQWKQAAITARSATLEFRQLVSTSVDALDDGSARSILLELLKLDHSALRMSQRIDLQPSRQLIDDFETDLLTAKPFFRDGTDPAWLVFEAMHLTHDAQWLSGEWRAADAATKMTTAIERFQTLLRHDYGNLKWRQMLAVALMARAEYARHQSYFEQAKSDLDTARTLAISLKRDGEYSLESFKLDSVLDYKIGNLYLSKGLLSDAEFSFAKLDARAGFWLPKSTNAKIAGYAEFMSSIGMAKLFMQKKEFDAANSYLERARSTISDQEHRAQDDINTLLNLYYTNIVKIESYDEIDKSKNLFDESLQIIEEIMKTSDLKYRWIDSKAYVSGMYANKMRTQGNVEMAIQHYSNSFNLEMEAFRLHTKNATLLAHAIYYLRKMVEIQTEAADWSGAIKTIQFALDSGTDIPSDATGFDNLLSHWKAFVREAENAKMKLEKTLAKELTSPVETFTAEIDNLKELSVRIAALQNPDASSELSDLRSARNELRKLELPNFGMDPNDGVLRVADGLSWGLKPLVRGSWRNLTGQELKDAVRLVASTDAARKIGDTSRIRRVRVLRLPFYPNGTLMEAQFTQESTGDLERSSGQLASVHILTAGDSSYWLNGTSPPILEANEKAPIRLDDAEMATFYLRFFTSFLADRDGNPFQIIEFVDDLYWQPTAREELKRKVGRLIRPLVVWPDTEQMGAWQATATVIGKQALFHCKFRIHPDHMVEMIKEIPVATRLPLQQRPFKQDGVRATNPVKAVDLREFGEKPNVGNRESEGSELLRLAKLPPEQRPLDHLKLLDEGIELELMRGGRGFADRLSLLNEAVSMHVAEDDMNNAYQLQERVVDTWAQRLRKVPRDHPRFPPSKFEYAFERTTLARLALLVGDVAKARKLAASALEDEEDNGWAAMQLAHALVAMNRSDEALTIYDKRAATRVDNVLWLELAGEELARLETQEDIGEQVRSFRQNLPRTMQEKLENGHDTKKVSAIEESDFVSKGGFPSFSRKLTTQEISDIFGIEEGGAFNRADFLLGKNDSVVIIVPANLPNGEYRVLVDWYTLSFEYNGQVMATLVVNNDEVIERLSRLGKVGLVTYRPGMEFPKRLTQVAAVVRGRPPEAR